MIEVGGDLADVVWERVALLPDCAFAALGATEVVDDEDWAGRGLPFLTVRPDGLGMLYGRAECDGLPIEIGLRLGEPVAARMEFTDDVAKLEERHRGRWLTLGELRIGSDGAVAVDKKHQHLDAWRVELPLPAGTYRAQVFESGDDHLGIRLIRASVESAG